MVPKEDVDIAKKVEALLSRDNAPEALRLARTMAKAKPNVFSYTVLGTVYEHMGSLNSALSYFNKALQLEPQAYVPRFNVGNVYRKLKKFREAQSSFEKAIEVAPNEKVASSAQKSLACLHLLEGRLDTGFRLLRNARDQKIHKFPIPTWAGESLRGKTLLVHERQGFGDFIHFSRYLREIDCGDILLEVPQSLHGIMSLICPGVRCATKDDTHQADYAITLMELPIILGLKRLDDINPAPYLKLPDPVECDDTVAVTWASNNKEGLNALKSCPFDVFSHLFLNSSVNFVSTQMGEVRETANIGKFPNVVDAAPHIDSFLDTARIIARAKLVITVDTALAHLAGSMGKEVWIILAHDADWRWHLDEGSRWYGSARLFRQPAPNNWQPVIKTVGRELRKVTEG